MSEIKIAVACHKPSELPKNKLFLPVHVGAALSTKDLGIQKDNDGKNISNKNPQYCELTAQYWLWQNIKADYYGLCHYRRFLCFAKTDDKRNLRDQIEANMINSDSIQKYGLEDEALMQKCIEKNDIVVGASQKISRLYTPHGNKNTAYEHWVAHDRALIMKKDLDAMLDILEEVSPELGADAREYLSGPSFMGFNCFVMKKELFNEMCDIEFRVLEKLEKRVDLSDYCTQLTRIYGFMGEIISSAYVYHIEKSERFRVKHLPLVYFEYTDPLTSIEPKYPKKKNVIPVLFNAADNNPIKFGVILQSFLDHIDKKYLYDLVLLSDSMPSMLLSTYERMCAKFENVNFRNVDIKVYRDEFAAKYYLKDRRKKLEEDENVYFSILPFVPLILDRYDKMLVIDENIIICDSVVDLWQKYEKTEKEVAAANNLLIQSRINDVYFETAEKYLSGILQNPRNFFAINLFVWNFKAYRENHNETDIAKLYTIADSKGILRNKEEIINVLCETKVEFIDQRWNTWLESNDYLKYQLPYAPFDKYQKLQAARKNPGAVVYMDGDPWLMEPNDLYPYFWGAAAQTPLHDAYVFKASDFGLKRSKQKPIKNITQKVFPVGSPSRGKMTKIFPKGTKRYDAVRALMNALNIS